MKSKCIRFRKNSFRTMHCIRCQIIWIIFKFNRVENEIACNHTDLIRLTFQHWLEFSIIAKNAVIEYLHDFVVVAGYLKQSKNCFYFLKLNSTAAHYLSQHKFLMQWFCFVKFINVPLISMMHAPLNTIQLQQTCDFNILK